MLEKMRPYAGVIGSLAAVMLAFAALVGLVYQVSVITRDEIRDTRDEIRDVRREIRDVRQEVHDLRREMREIEQRLTQEIRLSQADMLSILGSHHHEDGSPPVFTIPPPGEPKARSQ